MDQLIIVTSRLNYVLSERGMPTITLPERHQRIEPFFNDLTALIISMIEKLES